MKPVSSPSSRWTGWGAALLALATLLAYRGSFSGPFVFDDLDSIASNPTIRHFWPLGRVWSPPFAAGQTVGGRPLLNLSFAANYAFGGTRVAGYHAVNLLIHLLGGLVLFGVARRTFRRLGAIAAARADALGFAVALLWLVHPLQTESVTYVVQRAESLMGLFYLLTLYCFIRGAAARLRPPARLRSPEASYAVASSGPEGRNSEDRKSTGWLTLSILCCFLGMLTKEVMVSAPVIVLLYDRTFLSGSFGAAWRRNRAVYLGLAASWVVLAAEILGAHGRGGTVGGRVAVSWTGYFLTQGPAIVHYLRLAVWPHPLVFDYGAEWMGGRAAAPALAGVLALVVATAVGLRRKTAAGFLGACFFAVLAPTSLMPGIRQTLAEHRMYLALAPVLGLVVGGIGLWPGWSGRAAARLGATALFAAAAACSWLTWVRNQAYRSDLALWSDTVARRPLNPYAHNDLGNAWKAAGRLDDAAGEFAEALRLKPDLPEADNNLGNILWQQGRAGEALALYRRALGLRPRYAEADNNLGVAATALGQRDEAVADFNRALAIDPDYAEARYNLGVALAAAGREPEAIAAYEAVLEGRPDFAEARLNLGGALARSGHLEEAIAQFREAIRERPDFVEAHYDEGNALAQAGRLEGALVEYQEALRLQPGNQAARLNLERVRAMLAARTPAP
jgi:tetratricopeptide (TPR) repeat protein